MSSPWSLTSASEAEALGGTLVGIAGLPGSVGSAGNSGAVWNATAGTFPGGNTGDMLIISAPGSGFVAGDYFQYNKTTNVWLHKGNLVGPTGAAGTPGTVVGSTVGSASPVNGNAALWDSNLNLSANNFLPKVGIQTANGTTVNLGMSSQQIQIWTSGSTNGYVRLTNSCPAGTSFLLVNNSTAVLYINNSDGSAYVNTLVPGASVVVFATVANAYASGGWVGRNAGLSLFGGSKIATVDASTLTFKVVGAGVAILTAPAVTDTLATLTATQAFTNKDFTDPSNTFPSFSGGAGNPTPTTVKTSAYTASVNDMIPVDCTAGGVAITLPTAPADKSRIVVKKMDTSANAVTINRGGTDVFNAAGGATSLTLVVQFQAVVLQYASATAIWYAISTDAPLGQLDTRYLNQSTTGNAATATKLATARNINGVAFDGSAAITVTDATAEKTANKNTVNGYAGLDSSGKVPAALWPSGIDEIIEYANLAAFPGTGASGIIYLAQDTEKVYRWSSSIYVEISPSPGSTDAVPEGVTNLYYTNARADARVAAGNAATATALSGKTTPTGALVGTTDTQALTNKNLTGAGNTFPTLNQSTSGNAATATKLATARNINGVLFDGTADITISGGGGATGSVSPVAGDAAEWDSNLNLFGNNFSAGFASTSPTTTTTLTAASAQIQRITGTGNLFIRVPSNVPAGWSFYIINAASNPMTINSSDGANFYGKIPAGTNAWVISVAANTAAVGGWITTFEAGLDLWPGSKLYIPNISQLTIGVFGAGAASITVPATTDTLAVLAAAQALTNKNLTDATNTFPTFNQNTTGNASTATKLAATKNINGVAFDGSADITVTDSTAEKTVNKNVASGYAGLDSGGKIPAALYPSSMDEVIEYANLAAFPGSGAAQTIYLALDTGKVYRWSGSMYVEISPSPGSTDSVAEGSTNLYYTNARADARVAAGNAASATKLATARNIDGVAFDGTSDISIIGPGTHAATSKTTPVDADELPITDSAASFGLKKLTWANLKATMKAYYDSATSSLSNKDLTSGTNTFPTLNQNTTGNAATATKLATARNINGVAFDGSADITISGGGGGATGSTTPTNGDAAEWDSNLNLAANNLLTPAPTSINTSALPASLTMASPAVINLIGSTSGGTLTLPTSSVPSGAAWLVNNLSTVAVTVAASAGATVLILAPGTSATFQTTTATPTLATQWQAGYGAVSVASGKSLSVLNSLTIGGTDGFNAEFPYPSPYHEYIGTGTLQALTGIAVPANIVGAIVTVVSPGSGGGSGRRGAASTVRCGGGAGGSGSATFDKFVPASVWGTTYSISLGAYGLGGAAVTTDDTNGNPGTAGGVALVTIGTNIAVASGTASGLGAGGTATTGTAGAAGNLGLSLPGASGAASTTGLTGTSGSASTTGGAAGAGAGGGISAANVASNGGSGNSIFPYVGAGTVPAAGVVGGALPGQGFAARASAPGQGGGGGAASITGAAQAGATALGYGGGGGGGGASLDGNNSGAGGNGAPGYILITWLYAY